MDLPGVHKCPNIYKCGPWTYLGSMNVPTSTSVVPGLTWGPWMSQTLQVRSPDLPGVHECPKLYKCGPWTYLGSMNVLTSTSVVPGLTWGPWMSQPQQVWSLDLPGVHECPNLNKCGPWTYLGSMNVPTSTSVFPGPTATNLPSAVWTSCPEPRNSKLVNLVLNFKEFLACKHFSSLDPSDKISTKTKGKKVDPKTYKRITYWSQGSLKTSKSLKGKSRWNSFLFTEIM